MVRTQRDGEAGTRSPKRKIPLSLRETTAWMQEVEQRKEQLPRSSASSGEEERELGIEGEGAF
jgi:hypothetical protein